MSLVNRVKNYKKDNRKIFNIDEMGNNWSDKHTKLLYFDDTFFGVYIRPHLKKLPLEIRVNRRDKICRIVETDVLCPFCKEDVITLYEIKKDWSSGISGFFDTKHHVGNTYRLKCYECDAHYWYNNQWRWID